MNEALKLFVLFALLLAYAKPGHAQASAEKELGFKGALYDVYIIRVDSSSLKRISLTDNIMGTKHKAFIEQNTLKGDSDFFLINACVSDATCKPEGLFIKNGKEINPLNLTDGNSNFYLKPNGALLLTKSEALIVESSKAAGIRNVVTGVQSGPLLINDGAFNTQIKEGSKNKNIRCGVGTFKKDNYTLLVFAISDQPVNFYDFACLFKYRFGCAQALCLESAGCAMFAPFINRNNNTDDNIICNYIIYRNNE